MRLAGMYDFVNFEMRKDTKEIKNQIKHVKPNNTENK